jgi:Fe-S cluster biogenesis protein NfuA/nitrite reductase/ring-hydroxylating ferredoxin subunit
MGDARQVGARVEELLGVLQAEGGPATAQAAEELVRLLLGLYGDGLRHIMSALRAEGEAGAAILDRLLADPLVESLLLLHDLHPLDIDARIQRALDQVRPYLGSHAGGVQYLGVTGEGVARLRLEGSCHGCPSSTVTVQLALKGAVEDAAPEVTEVVVEGMTSAGAAPLLQIGSRPPDPGAGPEDPPAELPGDVTWVTLPDIGPPSSRPVSTVAAGVPVLVCAVRGTLYAYRDACAVCAGSLADATLTVGELACASCGTRYDVRAAGRSSGDPVAHLDPIPLLTDSQGVRVAVASQNRGDGAPRRGVPAEPMLPGGSGGSSPRDGTPRQAIRS